MLSTTNQLLLDAIRAVNQLTIEVSKRLQTASSSLSVVVSQGLTAAQQAIANANLGTMVPLIAMPGDTQVQIGNAASTRIVITGTKPIESFGTAADGLTREIRFSASLELKHSANLVLIGAKNIITQAGDTARFESLGSGVWRMVSYARANGDALSVSALSGQVVVDALGAMTDADAVALSLNLDRKKWTTAVDKQALISGRDYGANTEAGAISMPLPATAIVGDEITVFNVTKSWLTNAFTVTCPEAHRIEGVADNLVCDFNIGGVTLKCVAVRDGVYFWRVCQ